MTALSGPKILMNITLEKIIERKVRDGFLSTLLIQIFFKKVRKILTNSRGSYL